MAAAAAADAPPAAAPPAAARRGPPPAAPPRRRRPPAPPPRRRRRPPPPPPPDGGRRRHRRCRARSRRRPPPRRRGRSAEEVETATITLRLPDEEPTKGEALAVGVHPGDRVRVLALVRNQSGIVDNYQIARRGAARGLVLGPARHGLPRPVRHRRHLRAGGRDPPAPAARARRPRRGSGSSQVVAHSKAQERTAATAPLLLGIQPFEEHDTKVKPERASGRRKANFKVTVSNKANAPVFVAFDASEADNELPLPLRPADRRGPARRVGRRRTMRVKPPKQIWIGRPHERRIDVATKTGDEAARARGGRRGRRRRATATRAAASAAS